MNKGEEGGKEGGRDGDCMYMHAYCFFEVVSMHGSRQQHIAHHRHTHHRHSGGPRLLSWPTEGSEELVISSSICQRSPLGSLVLASAGDAATTDGRAHKLEHHPTKMLHTVTQATVNIHLHVEDMWRTCEGHVKHM